MKRAALFILFAGLLIIDCLPSEALYLYVSFDEMVKQSEVIFLGRVTDQTTRFGPKRKMIFTDVYFEVEKLIYKSETSQPITGNSLTLTFTGGKVEEEIIRVSDVPSFETDSSYLIFTLMDGKTYASPIIGGFQGVFKVITDEESGIQYPLTYGRRGIQKIRDGHMVTSPSVSRIKGGVIEKWPEKVPDRFYDVAPKPAGWMDQTRAKAGVSPRASEKPDKIITLEELIAEIEKRVR